MSDIDVFSGLPVTRDKVFTLQAELSKLPQYQPETKHYFHGGMYCREVYREAGVIIVGRIHKKEHFYVVAQGTVLVTTEEGVQRLSAPAVVESKPGTKRAVYSETPAVCMTFHRTDATTPEEAEIELMEEEQIMFDVNNNIKLEVLQ